MHRSTPTTNPIDVDRSTTTNTPLAQRQSARLITWRSADQNPQGVIVQFVGFKETDGHSSRDPKHEQHFTDVAQRERAGLITLRSGVQITSSVLLHFASFIEAGRLASDVKRSQKHAIYRCGAEEARKAHNLEDT